MPANRPIRNGFTLIELSIVLVVLSLMASGILAALSSRAREAKQAQVQVELDTIQAALLDFSRAYNRLPCPADGTMTINAQYFGREGVNAGVCTTGSTYDGNGNRTSAASPGPTANFTDGGNTVGGVVPVKTLGLSEDAMFDPWGGQFTYAVDIRATGTSAFTTYLATDTVIGSITVMDGSAYPATGGNARTTKAVVLVMSHGPDGHGAFEIGGIRKATQASNSDELQNCHCDATAATTGAQPFNATFVQHDATSSATDLMNVYDDIVRFYLRGDLSSAAQDYTGR